MALEMGRHAVQPHLIEQRRVPLEPAGEHGDDLGQAPWPRRRGCPGPTCRRRPPGAVRAAGQAPSARVSWSGSGRGDRPRISSMRRPARFIKGRPGIARDVDHQVGGRNAKKRHRDPRASAIEIGAISSSRSCTREFRYSRTAWALARRSGGIAPPGGDAVQQVLRRRLGLPDRRPVQAEARLEFGEQADEISSLQASRGLDDILKLQVAREDRGIAARFLQQPVEGESRRGMVPLDRP